MSSVRVEDHGAVRVVAINRPDKLNALDEPCRLELLASLTDAARDDTVRVVVLTGIGRAFCTGQDLGVGSELEDAGATVRDTYNPLAQVLREMDKPALAAVNGPAVGAGLGLALGCDLRYMASSAYLACSFSRVALVPDTGTTAALVRQLGHARAFEVAVTGRKISAEEAADTHLVNEVVADEELLDAVLEIAGTLAAGPARAYALTKRLMVSAANSPESEVLKQEAAFQGVVAQTDDHREALAAFLGRRSKS